MTGKFQLWRSTSRANRTAYVGHIRTPEGLLYPIEAEVIEQVIDGKTVKHFEGQVHAPRPLNVTQPARTAHSPAAIDLLSPLEAEPFDDTHLLLNPPPT